MKMPPMPTVPPFSTSTSVVTCLVSMDGPAVVGCADAVLVHVQRHDHVVVRRDLRLDLEAQGRLAERDAGRAAAGRLLVGDLRALLDQRLDVVGR